MLRRELLIDLDRSKDEYTLFANDKVAIYKSLLNSV